MAIRRAFKAVLLLTVLYITNAFHLATLRSESRSSLHFMALKDPKLNDTATATAAVLKLYTSTTGISSRNGNRTLATSNSTLHDLSEGQFPISFSTANLSRRDWLRLGAVAVGGTVVGGATIRHSWMDHQLYQRRHPAILLPKKLAPVNLTQVARETSLNVTLDYPKTIVSLDHSTFQKKWFD